jgi:hypothetical protein
MITAQDIKFTERNTPLNPKQIDVIAEVHLGCVAPLDRSQIAAVVPAAEAAKVRERVRDIAANHLWDRIYGEAYEALTVLEKELSSRAEFSTPEDIRKLLAPLREKLQPFRKS